MEKTFEQHQTSNLNALYNIDEATKKRIEYKTLHDSYNVDQLEIYKY